MPESEAVVVSIPRSARIAAALGGILLLGILAVLVAVLVSLEGSRSEIRTTRVGVTEAERRSQRLAERLRPLIDATLPLTEKSSQRDLRRAGAAISDAAGSVPALADDARRGVGAAAFIAETLQGSDLGHSLAALRLLTDTAVPALRDLAPSAVRLLKSQRDINSESLATQRATLELTERIQALFVESLAVQRETLGRVRSLDRKTGGPVPGTTAAP